MAGLAFIDGVSKAARYAPNHDLGLLALGITGIIALTLAAYVLDKAINR